ncbi:hypothetical protein T281_16150 [Rhodomicrobium udaipurense JA643]|uniref:DUF262 domain-containing protein n=1 Tax=Rhodomicrobium udaipurense TaxID=1202716 RepID=A0A8I1GAB2_9HYPH|nr:DUF262 domain-containing protein [Rhodomicrobium udaipurense]KAI93525.1 hypothetical protein T281_16150 [Rhodomicrobium udaipurense JA643]MBJ7543422.1 DUF262 domain-containing protein [Rhodomicrobium udaipurense]
MSQARPLIAESSTSESANIKTVLDDMAVDAVVVPDYQRDSDQWDDMTKSLLIESVINNLSIPAFFFEVETGEIERNSVIDGQQRLTTLNEFYNDELRLVDSDAAPYISPDSVHYAGKKFSQLPKVYQDAFKRYRLTIIKLRGMGEMRLEVFRRINQGGTPLSAQDIRLAYYGQGSRSLAFVRLVGITDKSKHSSQSFLLNAKKQFLLGLPLERVRC